MSQSISRARTKLTASPVAFMTEHDLVEVVEMEETCGLSRWGWEAYYRELGQPNTIMLVAHSKSRGGFNAHRLSGFVAARIMAGEVHINNIAVRLDARRCGIGSALLNRALELAAERGARSAVLEVRAANFAAQQLYKRFGFQVIGRRYNYYKEPPDDALVMAAEIGKKT